MARTDPVLQMLAEVDLFEGISRADLRRIYTAGKEVDFAAGEDLIIEGRQGGRFFLILEGQVDVSIRGRTLRSFGPGEYLGEISLIDGQPRSASAVAVSPVRTWSLSSWNFKPLLRTYPSVAEKIMLLLCRRLRNAEAAAGTVS
jgi:CRP/FNR family cyclic AMP-dependent transcriptional regulator